MCWWERMGRLWVDSWGWVAGKLAAARRSPFDSAQGRPSTSRRSGRDGTPLSFRAESRNLLLRRVHLHEGLTVQGDNERDPSTPPGTRVYSINWRAVGLGVGSHHSSPRA